MTSPAVRTALVTGGTRGIGLGIARALAADGWGLVICGMRPEQEVGNVLEELRHQGGPVEYVAADIASIPDRARLVELTHARAGAVQALVNNAGRAPDVRADLLDATEASFERVLRTNLQGPYFLTQAASALMMAERRGDSSAPSGIVFVTSVSAEFASPNRGEYCVSKAGLAMAVKLFPARLA